jgi:hypothetical protein
MLRPTRRGWRAPPTESFNDPANWTPTPPPPGWPTGTASFGASSQLAPLIEADTSLNEIEFTDSAPEYTIGVGFVGTHSLTLNGLGVVNSSPVQGIEVGSSGTLIFNSGTAGINTHYTNLGGAIVFNDSTAGSADFQNENSSTTTGTITFNNSHAGTGEFDNDGGTLTFENGSHADSVKIFSTGMVNFTGGSNADTAVIDATELSDVIFRDTSTAGASQITAGEPESVDPGFHAGFIKFFDQSTAGNANITALSGSNIEFHDSSTGGNAILISGNGGDILFNDNSTAGNATITVQDGGFMEFGHFDPFSGFFGGPASAGDANITIENGGFARFETEGTGGSATITIENGGTIKFYDMSTAAQATITVNSGGTLDFSPTDFREGAIQPGGTSTVGTAAITNNGSTGFYQGSSAANSTITTNAGGVTSFYGRSSGGNAAFITNAGGAVDFSGLGTFPDTGAPIDPSITGTTAGSIAARGPISSAPSS